jgi:hypothetical protein
MGESALNLSQRCLSFDFIGTNPDESSEDVGTIQVSTHIHTVYINTGIDSVCMCVHACISIHRGRFTLRMHTDKHTTTLAR